MVTTQEFAWRHRSKLVVGALIVTVGAVSHSPWRVSALRASPPVQGVSAPIRTVPAGTRVAEEPGKKGDTYYWLESQTTRLTTRFADGATIVAERGNAGELRAKVHDQAGNETASFAARSTSLQYAPAAGEPLQALNDSGERVTLAWASRQAYSLWKDGRRKLQWQGGLMRPQGAARNVEQEIVELQAEWANGLSAKSTRTARSTYTFTDNRTKKPVKLSGERVSARLVKDGVLIGSAAWFPQNRVFVFDYGQLGAGYIAPEHLAHSGGWTFIPDMEWLNLQTIALHHFKAQMQANGLNAKTGAGCGVRRDASISRLLNFFVPTVYANQDGCDGLHWADGTVFRPCCDVHDQCYFKIGCDVHSWWFDGRWLCTYCNVSAVYCFVTGGCSCIPGFAELDPVEDHKTRVAQVQT